MRRFILIFGCAMLAINASSQSTHQHLVLPDSVASVKPDWIDADKDGLLDIMLLMKTNSGKDYIGVIKGDTLGTMLGDTVKSLIVEKIFQIIPYDAYLLTDFDRDNDIDIIISGNVNGDDTTMIYQNNGDLKFQETVASIPYFTTARTADFDDNATPEIIVSGIDVGGPYTKILKQINETTWVTVHDSLKMHCSSIQTFDADGDGDNDLFLSGTLESGAPTSGFYINEGQFYFKSGSQTPLRGNTSTGDLDGDGFFDVILMGEDENGLWHTKKYQRVSGNFSIQDLSITVKNGIPFVADFDHDGVPDIHYSGTDQSGQGVSEILYSGGTTLPLPAPVPAHYRFGDLEHNGNIQFVYSMLESASWVVGVADELSNVKNEAPGRPQNGLALPIFDRVFMYWDKPTDDHTPKASLTYDVFLNGVRNYEAGEFDIGNERRLTVTHGNNNTKNYRLLKDIDPTDLEFAIQAVDNSFHAGSVCLGTMGSGPGGPNECTPTVEIAQLSVCSQEQVILSAPAQALWFSFRDGFLGINTSYAYSAGNSLKGDTIFYFNPSQSEDCGMLKAWTIDVDNDTAKVQLSEKYACEGDTLQLSVEEGWQSVSWSSTNQGNLGSNQGIELTVSNEDSVIVRLVNTQGCQIVRKTAVKISKPILTVVADHYKIVAGGEVQLQASGAQRYTWTPPEGLSQPDIPDPVASPKSSIQYTVTGYDSLDCVAQADITITVEMGGFIPNLFSPNDDGQNDHLKIYGLNSAGGFLFTIYDREGSLVYKTSNVTEAVNHGWDGTKNGSKQPPGVYFWKVKGEVGSDRLLLNGKESGSIVLIR